MLRIKTLLLAALVICLAVAALTGARAVILAAPESPLASYSIPWWTVDGGGGLSQGGAFSLNGSIGQPDAGRVSGGSFTLEGGFWSGVLHPYRTYFPLVQR